jgi:hypothetical protein
MIGTWVLMVMLCNMTGGQCSYHLFGPTYPTQRECLADLARRPRSRVIRSAACKELEAPGLIFTPSG